MVEVEYLLLTLEDSNKITVVRITVENHLISF